MSKIRIPAAGRRKKDQRRDIHRQMREAATKKSARARRRSANSRTPFKAEGGQGRGPHQQGPLDDQHKSGRHDVAGVAVGRIVQRLHQQLGRAQRGQGQPCLRAVHTHTARNNGHVRVPGTFGDPLQCAVEHEKVRRIDIGRDASFFSPSRPRAGCRAGFRGCRRPGGRTAAAAPRREPGREPPPKSPRRRRGPGSGGGSAGCDHH